MAAIDTEKQTHEINIQELHLKKKTTGELKHLTGAGNVSHKITSAFRDQKADIVFVKIDLGNLTGTGREKLLWKFIDNIRSTRYAVKIASPEKVIKYYIHDNPMKILDAKDIPDYNEKARG